MSILALILAIMVTQDSDPNRVRFNFKEFCIGMCKLVGFCLFASVFIGMVIHAVEKAHGQTRTYQDPMGRQTGTSVTNGNTTTFSDSLGRNTGRATTNNGTTTVYDQMGRQTGTIRGSK